MVVHLADGAMLHYVERGTGPPLILLHGGTGDMTSWEPQLDAFSKRFRTIAYSRRLSHPNRNPDRAASDPAEADMMDLCGFMSCLRIESAHLVATSYGALVALKMALARPECVRSLVLAEPPLHEWVNEVSDSRPIYQKFMDDVWHPAARQFGRGRSREAMRILAVAFDGAAARAQSSESDAFMNNARAMAELALSAHPFRGIACESAAKLRVLLVEVFGEDAGRGVRTAVGMTLPFDMAVEVELVAEIE